MHKNHSALGYFLGGITAGSMAAIFLAPKSGRETRRYLRRRADASTDYVKRRADEISKNATDVIDRGNKKVHSQMDSLARAVAAVCR